MGTPRLIRARRADTEAAKAGRTSPLAVAAELQAAGVRPRKSRGQNFLIQPAIADRIVAAGAIEPGEEVVEVGPGLGILSDKILRAGVRRLWLVELDPRLAERLQSAFAGHPAVRVVCRDFLEVDLAELVERPPVKVIGNLPFNAAGANSLESANTGRANRNANEYPFGRFGPRQLPSIGVPHSRDPLQPLLIRLIRNTANRNANEYLFWTLLDHGFILEFHTIEIRSGAAA